MSQVVALGRGGSNIAAKDAKAYVFGYGVGVDFTRRDMQARRLVPVGLLCPTMQR